MKAISFSLSTAVHLLSTSSALLWIFQRLLGFQLVEEGLRISTRWFVDWFSPLFPLAHNGVRFVCEVETWCYQVLGNPDSSLHPLYELHRVRVDEMLKSWYSTPSLLQYTSLVVLIKWYEKYKDREMWQPYNACDEYHSLSYKQTIIKLIFDW